MAFNRTLITAALPYANGPVHIGHLAGVYVPADIYARYLRLKGQELRRTVIRPRLQLIQETCTSGGTETAGIVATRGY